MHIFTGLPGQTRKAFQCGTALFDSHANLIVGDYCNKEIYILDGYQFNIIQKLPIDNMSHPTWFRLYNNILWVKCTNPKKVMCISMS